MSKRTIIAIFAVALLAGGGAFALWITDNGNNGRDSTVEITDDDQDDDATDDMGDPEEKERHSEGADSENQAGDGETGTDEGGSTTNDDGYDGSITLNNFGQRDNGTVYANATVDGHSDGTCKFRFSRNGTTVTETTSIETAPTGYYACGVQLDSSEFSPKGAWEARALIRGTEPQVESQTRTTEVQ